MRRLLFTFSVLSTAAVLACGNAPQDAQNESATMDSDAGMADAAGEMTNVPTVCQPMLDNMELEGRPSPYDSTVIALGDTEAKLCYGRPSARGRTMIGGEDVPYGELWRTGANEPTTLHLPVAAEIAGIAVQPGSYSVYTVPDPEEWQVIVNASTSQWGHESRYTEEVRAQEVGRGTVPAERLDEHVETLTFRSVAAENGADLVLDWEHSSIRIPVRLQ